MNDILPRRFEACGVICVWEEDLLKAEAEVARLTAALAEERRLKALQNRSLGEEVAQLRAALAKLARDMGFANIALALDSLELKDEEGAGNEPA